MPRPNHLLWKAAEIFFSSAAFFLFTIAILSPDWAKQSLTFPDREDVVISRGLFQVNIYDGYGTFVSSVYDMQDEIGERVDPYCGASSRPSVFVSQLPLLVGNYSIDPKVFGNASSSYKPTRSDDEFGWCRRKHASQIALMVGILPAVLAPLFVFVSIVCTRVSCRFAMLSILTSIISSICGFISMCVMGGWIVEAKRAHQLLDIPSESNWSGGMAFACIIIASIFGVASALVVLVDLCTSKKACTRAAAAAAESQPLLPAYRELDHGNVQKVPVYDA